MARTDRAYRKMMRRKTMLCAEKDYRDILLRDCQEQARKKTDTYRTQLMRELYTAHPDWIPAEEAGKIVFDSRMAQFDADMAFVRKQASTRAAKAISKDPACAEREEEKLQQLQKEHEELRNQYSCRLQQEISAQLTDMSGDGAEREAAVSDIERKVDAFRAEQEKAAQKQMETIRQAEDSKIQKLSDALGKLRLAPADRPGLPEGVVLRVQDLCMYFGGVHAVDGLSFDVKKGEIFGLIGPNGAGKTTVFNCITQFYKPTSGTLLFENKAGEVISLPEEKVHDVVLQGIVRTFQNVEVIREVSVLDNLLIAGASAVYGRDFVSGSTPADAEEAGAHYKGEGPPCAGIHGPYGVQRLVCRRPALRDPEENRDRTHTDVRPPADYIGRACRGSERHRDFGAGGADSPHPGYHGLHHFAGRA